MGAGIAFFGKPVWSWAFRALIAFIASGVSLKSGLAQRSVLCVGVLCALPKIFKVCIRIQPRSVLNHGNF